MIKSALALIAVIGILELTFAVSTTAALLVIFKLFGDLFGE